MRGPERGCYPGPKQQGNADGCRLDDLEQETLRGGVKTACRAGEDGLHEPLLAGGRPHVKDRHLHRIVPSHRPQSDWYPRYE
jgi:hypothetical protein